MKQTDTRTLLIGRFIILWLLSLGLYACTTTYRGDESTGQGDKTAPGSDRYHHDNDGPPLDPVDANLIPEPVPRPEPLARYGNHSPYTVFGTTYTVLPSAQGYVAEGLASWYGRKFHGYLTSSQEPYDMLKMTAAHRSLPLPTYARVTNLDNRKSVIVRINDRGPFHPQREIDLSWAAAARLGIDQTGTGRVRVEAISLSPSSDTPTGAPASMSEQTDSDATQEGLYLQMGAYSQLELARQLANRLLATTDVPVSIRSPEAGKSSIHRVWIGPFASDQHRQKIRTTLRQSGFHDGMPLTSKQR